MDYQKANIALASPAGWLGAERQDQPRPERRRVQVKVTLLRIVRPGAPLVWHTATVARAAIPDPYATVRRRLGFETAALPLAPEVL
jgi:hypothetical protein